MFHDALVLFAERRIIDMEKIKNFIECLLPVTSCNIKCSYCYVIQEGRREMEIPRLNYSVDTMIRAMTKERFGGVCYFSICGAGETLIPEYTLDIVQGLLENGHYVNITTNGTITKRFEEIEKRFSRECCERLHFAFSFHYLELKRLNLIEHFFENVNRVKKLGSSFVVQLNFCDEYVPYVEEIKKVCVERVGAYPQLALTRREKNYPNTKYEIDSDLSEKDYLEMGRKFDSELFEFTYKQFMKKRKEFCYAGDWSYVLNLKTGLLKRCYQSCVVQNIFENIEKPIFKCAVGKCCNQPYCINSSHFMSLGIIPEIETPSYANLRNREEGNWYNEGMKEALGGKLAETNGKYGMLKKWITFFVGIYDKVAYKAYLILLTIKINCEKNVQKKKR